MDLLLKCLIISSVICERQFSGRNVLFVIKIAGQKVVLKEATHQDFDE